jgi:hypothetical protein
VSPREPSVPAQRGDAEHGGTIAQRRATVDQDGARVVRALPTTVPYQDPVSGAMTTGGLATVTVRDWP